MKQLILPKDYNGQKTYTLSEQDSHYLITVQRKEVGYTLNLLDMNGNSYIGSIIDIKDGLCCLNIEKTDRKLINKRELILFQSIPKGKKIDLMIRQSVEIGVSTIVPIMAEHSIPTFSTEADKEKKRERWNKIIKEASQQSGTEHLTKLNPLKTFKKALEELEKPYTGIYFHQVPLKNRPLHSLLNSAKDRVVIVIGPEGGLSNKEVELLNEYHFNPALLGSNILRAETATTFALGAVQMILLENNSWNLNIQDVADI